MALADLLMKMPPDVRQTLEDMVKQIQKSGSLSALQELYAMDYEREPVPIRTFLEDDYYLGSSVRNLHENWKTQFDDIFATDSTYTTLIFTGSIGCGKTTAAAVCLTRKLYELTCLKDPAEFYGLLPKSKIVFGLFNITMEKADDISEKMKQFIDASPYFREVCPRKSRPDDPIYIPSKNIEVSVGSLATHALGDNILAFVLDEANFYKKVKDADNPTEKTRAHQLVNEANTRLVSRFMKHGSTPGLVILISSRKFQSSFLDEKIDRVRTDPMEQNVTKVVEFALWQTKPASDFTGKHFDVLVGTEHYPSRVLEQDEVLPEDAEVVTVPEEYRQPFNDDADLALRDIAGISTVGSKAFFPVMDRIFQCLDSSRKHPFTKPVFSTPLGSNVKIESFFEERKLCRIVQSKWVPLVNPSVPRHVHLDLAYSEENLGFVMGHPCMTMDGKMGAYIDFMLRIVPPIKGEIELGTSIEFLKYLRAHGFMIEKITFDQFQSRMPIQLLIQAGFDAELLSVDLLHYVHLKTCINEKRISMYEYAPVLRELKSLQRDLEGGRPSHPQGEFDDVSDALAAVVSRCYNIQKSSVKKGKVSKDKVRIRGAVGPMVISSVGGVEQFRAL